MQKIETNEIDLVSLFPPDFNDLISLTYGRPGEGKTYAITADIIEALKQGRTVYANFMLNWDGFDQREDFFSLLAGMLGIKRRYYKFLNKNFHYIAVDENFHNNLQKLTDCIVVLDEGYVAFDSYEMAKLSLLKRQNVLHTRHFDRSIWITSQRPTNIHVVFRGNVNWFYKCTKIITWPIVIFRKQQFDLNQDEKVDEDNAVSTKFYIGRKKIFHAYDNKYLRGNTPRSQYPAVEIYALSYKEICYNFYIKLFGKRKLKLPQTKPTGVKYDITALKRTGGLNTASVGEE